MTGFGDFAVSEPLITAACAADTRRTVAMQLSGAMEKGIPLPEFPLDPPRVRTPPDPRAPLIHGIVWLALGGGWHAGPAIDRAAAECPGALAAAAADCVPRHRVDAVLRPCLRERPLTPPRTVGSEGAVLARRRTIRGAAVRPCWNNVGGRMKRTRASNPSWEPGSAAEGRGSAHRHESPRAERNRFRGRCHTPHERNLPVAFVCCSSSCSNT